MAGRWDLPRDSFDIKVPFPTICESSTYVDEPLALTAFRCVGCTRSQLHQRPTTAYTRCLMCSQSQGPHHHKQAQQCAAGAVCCSVGGVQVGKRAQQQPMHTKRGAPKQPKPASMTVAARVAAPHERGWGPGSWPPCAGGCAARATAQPSSYTPKHARCAVSLAASDGQRLRLQPQRVWPTAELQRCVGSGCSGVPRRIPHQQALLHPWAVGRSTHHRAPRMFGGV